MVNETRTFTGRAWQFGTDTLVLTIPKIIEQIEEIKRDDVLEVNIRRLGNVHIERPQKKILLTEIGSNKPKIEIKQEVTTKKQDLSKFRLENE